MPGESLSMRKIRELLRLRWEQHLPQRVIASSLRLGQAPVGDYLSRARRAGLTWPLSNILHDAQLEALLFPPLPDVPSDQRPVTDRSAVHRDLRQPNGCLALLWEEYRKAATDGFGARGSTICIARGRAADADVAPSVYRGRAAVRRIRRPHHRGNRCSHRRDPAYRKSSSPCSAPQALSTTRPLRARHRPIELAPTLMC